MKRLLLVVAVAMLYLGSVAVPADASSIVEFVGRVANVPADIPDAAGPPTVELYVEPTWEVERAAEAAGEVVSMISVAQGTATPSFSLSLDLDSLGPRFVAAEGYVNVLVAAEYGGRVASWGMTVWTGDSLKQVPPFDMSQAAAPPTAAAIAARSSTARLAGESTDAAAPPCGQIYWYDYNGPYQTKIMDIMNPGLITGTGTYFHGGSTSTTLGYLTNGFTNWKVGGTMTSGSSSGSGFSANLQNQRMQSLWMYRERAVVCVGNQNVPVNYYGRGNSPTITHAYYAYCGGRYYAGDSYFHDYSSNQTYSIGLTVYGLNLSSQAGYVSTASLKFYFNTTGKVCGNSSTRGEDSAKVEAEKV